MLDSVIGNYLDTLSEREFDAPFLCLLRALGFYDLHFLHGPFEFGKDFIAKRQESGEVVQYAFQTKSGNIGQSDWREVRGQCDELRTNCLAHPNFEKGVVRKAVLVLTGRLVGGAIPNAQDYSAYLKDRGELDLTMWDRERLVELYLEDTTRLVGLHASAADLLTFLGNIGSRATTRADVAKYASRWLLEWAEPAVGARSTILQASFLAHHLRTANRLDLAVELIAHVSKCIWYHAYDLRPTPLWIQESMPLVMELFKCFATALADQLTGNALEKHGLLHSAVGGPAALVTYPIRCASSIEYLGLLGLLHYEMGNETEGNQAAQLVSDLISNNPASAHPISDNYAVSLIPPALLLCRRGFREQCASWLKKVVVWLCDSYSEKKVGLAKVGALPAEELEVLLGHPYQFIELSPRKESYIASVLLDLFAVLELGDLYELALNDFVAVGITPSQLAPKDTKQALTSDAQGADWLLNPDYPEKWTSSGWKVAPHHRSCPESFYPMRNGSAWALVAASTALRDRHFLTALRALAMVGQTPKSNS